MNSIIINDNNLKEEDIQAYGNKARAILLSDDKVLVSNYGGVILLPGGSIDKNETPDDAIIRELKEETGIVYDLNQLEKVLTIKYYQHDYPTRNNEIINRLMITQYYLGKYKGINLDNTRMTKKEIKDNFHLELIDIDKLLIQSNVTTNPRKEYFDRENQEVIKIIKKHK